MPSYYAHSRNQQGHWHDLVHHLQGVADKAANFAGAFEAEELGYYAGLWHDLGKFNPAWQAYLEACDKDQKPAKSIDHKAAGSLLAKQQRLDGLSLLIQAHHGGLQKQQDWKDWLTPRQNDPVTNAALRIARPHVPNLLPTVPIQTPAWLDGDRLTLEFFLRMLFSALVDADFLDTEAHFDGVKAGQRQGTTAFNSLWPVFEQNQAAFVTAAAPAGSQSVNSLRRQIYDDCVAAALIQPGLFRLRVPTGGGKTRSALAFALRHAAQYDLERIIVALPFTTITEQTASVYRAIFEAQQSGENESVVLEHHSATNEPEESREAVQDGDFRPTQMWRRLAAENWDAPIVVTTTVQLFESLFSNRTGKCRKLHRLAKSVIILDEAQSLPLALLNPILSAITELARHYGTTVVLSTATQPAFEYIPDFRDLAAREIIPDPAHYFDSLKRVNYDWQLDTPWPDTNWFFVSYQC